MCVKMQILFVGFAAGVVNALSQGWDYRGRAWVSVGVVGGSVEVESWVGVSSSSHEWGVSRLSDGWKFCG